MAGAKPERGTSRVDIVKVVVGVGDCEVTSVFVAVVVGVANERSLPVVMEVVVCDGDPVGGVGDVAEAVVQIFVVLSKVTLNIAVIDPDVGGFVDADSVAIVGKDLID